jgi:SnoaL-like domain
MTQAQNGPVEDRLDALESRVDIEELITRYNRGVDQRDGAIFKSIWHSDASWEPPDQKFKGSEAIVKGMLEVVGPHFPEIHHWTTNVLLTIAGNKADGTSDVTCQGVDVEGRTFILAASFDDEFERRDGRWGFVRRVVKIHNQNFVQLVA